MTTTIRQRKAASEQGVQITSEDLWLLDLLVRYHGVTAQVLMNTVYRGKHRSGVYRRLARLVRVGLLEDLSTGPSNLGRPRDVQALYVPTKRAYQLLNSNFHQNSIGLVSVRHTLAVAEVGLAFEAQGLAVVTDREIKRAIRLWRDEGGSSTPRDACWLGSDEGRRGVNPFDLSRPITTHAPDLIVTDAKGVRHAIEMELSSKNKTALLAVLHDYGRTDRFGSVIYYVADGYEEKRLKTLVDSMPPTARPTNILTRRYTPRHSTG